MNLSIAGFFGAIAIFLFLLALYEERKNDGSDETDHMIIIFMFLSFFFCVFAGITIMYHTIAYVDSAGALQIYYDNSYQPFGWLAVALGVIPFLMGFVKVLDYLGSRVENR